MIQYNNYLNKLLGMELIRVLPREATKFAKDYFSGKEIKVIEIGTLKGEHAKSILKNLNVKEITLIDPYEDYKSDGNYINAEIAEEIAKKRLQRYSNKILWIKDYSEKAINKIEEKMDFIYIDGNHEYEYVKKDLELYWKILKEGGIISGHDIQTNGVSEAVIEFCNINKLKLQIGNRRDWWIVKDSPTKTSKEERE